MKVRDKNLRKDVDVYDKDCPKRACYQPIEWKGNIIPGVGYQYAPKSSWHYRCGTRDRRGCPDAPSPPAPEVKS